MSHCKTGLMYDPIFAQYKAADGYLCLTRKDNPWIEEDDYYDAPDRVLQARTLLEKSGLLDRLVPVAATPAPVEELLSFHTPEYIEKLRSLIDNRLSDPNLSVEELGEQIGLSRVQLYRKTKALCGYSPNELLRIARLKRAASLLASTEKTVAEITYEVGFSSPSYFTKCYKEYFGEIPTEFLRRKNGGE